MISRRRSHMFQLSVWITAGFALLGAVVHCAPGEPNARCCFDQEYSVVLGEVGLSVDEGTGSATPIDGYILMSFDYYRDRLGTRNSLKQPDGSYSTTYELKDYYRRLIYTMKDNNTCIITDMEPFDRMYESCIPETATYRGPSTLGYGAHRIGINTWQFSVPVSANTTGQVIMSVTKDHCVPITETLFFTTGDTVVEETLFFVDYRPGIADINFLIPPAHCQRVSSSSGSDDFTPLGRRLIRKP